MLKVPDTADISRPHLFVSSITLSASSEGIVSGKGGKPVQDMLNCTQPSPCALTASSVSPSEGRVNVLAKIPNCIRRRPQLLKAKPFPPTPRIARGPPSHAPPPARRRRRRRGWGCREVCARQIPPPAA